jgi:hypothetical protein
MIFHADSRDSAPWLAEMVKVFITQNRLTLFPIINMNQTIENHQADLNHANSADDDIRAKTARVII